MAARSDLILPGKRPQHLARAFASGVARLDRLMFARPVVPQTRCATARAGR